MPHLIWQTCFPTARRSSQLQTLVEIPKYKLIHVSLTHIVRRQNLKWYKINNRTVNSKLASAFKTFGWLLNRNKHHCSTVGVNAVSVLSTANLLYFHWNSCSVTFTITIYVSYLRHHLVDLHGFILKTLLQ